LRDRLSPSVATDYQFKLGTGLARFGQHGRAREALTVGLALAETHGLNAWYFRIEQALQEVSLHQEPGAQQQENAEPSHAAVVDEVMLGLQEYAAAAEV
jgi:hypothetical protein